MRAPAGIELLPDGTWDCGSTGGEWSPGGCGCGSGGSCGCGGSCGGKQSGGVGQAPRLPDYDGEIWASPVRTIVDRPSKNQALPGSWDCGSTGGEWSPGGCGGSCGGCNGEGGACGSEPSGGSGEVPLLPDYNGDIWASPLRAVVAGQALHSVWQPRLRENQGDGQGGNSPSWLDPAAIWANTFADGVCMAGQGNWCCIEVLCHTLRRAVNNLGSLAAARKAKAPKHCWLEVADCEGNLTSYEVEPVQNPGDFFPGPKSNLIVGAKNPAPRDKNGDVLPVAKQNNDDIESRGWDCWSCEPVGGGCLDPVCSLLGVITDNYPWYNSYSIAGPNSNTFVAYMAAQLGMDVAFDRLDVGADYEGR